MRRDSRYFNLQWLVMEAPPGSTWFEPVAAFASEDKAVNHADSLYERAPVNVRYQVWERVGKAGWKIIYDI